MVTLNYFEPYNGRYLVISSKVVVFGATCTKQTEARPKCLG